MPAAMLVAILVSGLALLLVGVYFLRHRDDRTTQARADDTAEAATGACTSQDLARAKNRGVATIQGDVEAAAESTAQLRTTEPGAHRVPTATDAQLGVRAFMRGDYERAFRLLEPAAREDHLKAQILLSKMYYAGHGVERDAQAYAYWLQRAADNGDKPSRAKLKKVARQTAR